MHTHTIHLSGIVGASGISLPTGVSDSLPKHTDVTEKEKAMRKHPLGEVKKSWGVKCRRPGKVEEETREEGKETETSRAEEGSTPQDKWLERIICVAQDLANINTKKKNALEYQLSFNQTLYSAWITNTHIHTQTHTWSTVVLLHPDVAVALGHAGLGVQEGETHGSLGTQTGIVAATVFNGLLVEFLTKTETGEIVSEGCVSQRWKPAGKPKTQHVTIRHSQTGVGHVCVCVSKL